MAVIGLKTESALVQHLELDSIVVPCDELMGLFVIELDICGLGVSDV